MWSTALNPSTRHLISSSGGSRLGGQQLPGRRRSNAHASAAGEPNSTSNTSSTSSSSNDSSSSSRTSSTRRRRRSILFSRPGSSSRSRGAKPAPSTPAAPSSAAAAAELFGDAGPDSPGSQERALLMAYLDSLDPQTAAAFTDFMQQQLKETAQVADERAAADAAQALLDAALASDDPTAFLKTRSGIDLVMDTVRSQFSPDEAALLDSFFGADWAAAGGRSEPEMLQRLASLGTEQQLLLANILSKAEGLNKQAESLQQRTQQEAADSSTETTTTSSSSSRVQTSTGSRSHTSSGDASSSSSSRSWGSSFSRSKNKRAARARQQEATEHWDQLLHGQMSGRLQKMVALAGQAAKGKLQFGRAPDKHLQELKRLTDELLDIETHASNGAVSPQAFRAFVTARDARLNAMLEDEQGLSAACQSVLIFMELLFNPFAEDTAAGRAPGSAAAAEAAADAAGEQERQQPRRWQDLASLEDQRRQLQQLVEVQQQRPVVSLQRIAKLRRFVRAAANLEAFQAWAEAFAANHPGLAAAPAGGTQLSGLEGDLWFVAPQWQAEARAATEAAIADVDELAERLAAQAAGQQQEGSSSSSSGGGGGLSEADMLLAVAARASAVCETLLPHVDEERIAAVAALDADVLWFLAELEASSYDEGVLLKWSLHPSIGPALQHGRLLSELQMPEELRRLYQAAKVPDFMPSLNFDTAKMEV